jgi:hypothetical protein
VVEFTNQTPFRAAGVGGSWRVKNIRKRLLY